MNENEEFEFRLRHEQEQADAAAKAAAASQPQQIQLTPAEQRAAWEKRFAHIEKPNAFESWLVRSAPGKLLGAIPDAPVQGLVEGYGDPAVGLMQLGANVLGQGDKFNEWVKQREAKYQAKRAGRGDEGLDAWRMGGNLISPTNVIPASRMATATTLPARMAQGAGLGAFAGLSNPVSNPDDYWGEKAKETILGGLFGGLLPGITTGAANFIKPQVNEVVKRLQDRGIRTTVGQTLGGWMKGLEDKATSLPLVGDAIQSARRGSIEDFNRALYNKVLEPLGETIDKKVKVGHDALQELHKKVADAYDDVFNNVKLEGRPQLALPAPGAAPRPAPGSYLDDLANLRDSVSHIPKSYQREYDKVMKGFFAHATPQGNMSGESLTNAISYLRQKAQNLNNTNDLWAQKVRDAIKESGSTVLNALERQNPDMADKLRAAREAWHGYAIVRDAAASKGAQTTGVVMPSQVQTQVSNAVKKLEGQAAGKGKLSEGRAYLQDFVNDAQKVLPSSYPDSGTAGRLMAGAGGLGGLAYMLNPKVAATYLTGALPYLPGGRQVSNWLLTGNKLPEQLATSTAGALRQAGPLLAPAVAPALSPLAQSAEQ